MEKTMKRQRRDLEKEKVKNKIQASVAFTGANEVQQAQHLAEQAAMTAEEQASPSMTPLPHVNHGTEHRWSRSGRWWIGW